MWCIVIAYVIGMTFFIFEDYMFSFHEDFIYRDVKNDKRYTPRWIATLIALGLILGGFMGAIGDVYLVAGCIIFFTIGFMIACFIAFAHLCWEDWLEEHPILWVIFVLAIGLAVVGIMNIFLFFGGLL